MALSRAPLARLFLAAWAACWVGSLPPARALGSIAGWVAAACALLGLLAAASPRLGPRRTVALFAVVALSAAAAVSSRLYRYGEFEAHVVRGDRGVFAGRIVEVQPSSAKGLALRLRPEGAPRGFDVELLASLAEVERALALHPPGHGGRVEWPLRIYPYRPAGNPWELDRRLWAAERGYVARAYFDNPVADPFGAESTSPPCMEISALLERLGPVDRLSWRWRCRLYRALGPGPAPVAIAMALGQKDLIDPALREAFARSGTAHLLAVSGVHVGFVAMAALALLRPLIGSSRKAAWRALGALAGTAAIGAYVLLVGGPASALRAGIMSSAALLARVAGRRSNPLQALGAAGLALLAAEPLVAFDLGFQLSFGATFGILTAVRAFGGVAAGYPRFARSLIWSGILSAAAMAFTLPPSLGAFSTLPWLSPVANVVAIPVGAASILALLCGLIAAEVHLRAGFAILTFGGYGIEALIRLARSVPDWGALEMPAPGPLFTAGWYALAFGLVRTIGATRRESSARSLEHGRRLAVIGAFALAFSSVGDLVPDLRGDIRIVVVDVGQGDAILIRAPWERNILVDGGPAVSGGYDAGAHRVLPFLKRLGVRKLDAVVSTHPDADHVGGLAEVILGRKVGSVYASWAESETAAYRRFVRSAHEKGLPVLRLAAGDAFHLGRGARIDVLASGNLSEWGDRPSALSSNDRSIALAVQNGTARFLLLGDMEDRGIGRLMERFDLAADGLVTPHHGSPGPFWDALLERVSPKVAAISVGPNNFGHPSPELLEILARRGVQVARTDLCGAIFITLRRDGAAMTSYRESECRKETGR